MYIERNIILRLKSVNSVDKYFNVDKYPYYTYRTLFFA